MVRTSMCGQIRKAMRHGCHAPALSKMKSIAGAWDKENLPSVMIQCSLQQAQEKSGGITFSNSTWLQGDLGGSPHFLCKSEFELWCREKGRSGNDPYSCWRDPSPDWSLKQRLWSRSSHLLLTPRALPLSLFYVLDSHLCPYFIPRAGLYPTCWPLIPFLETDHSCCFDLSSFASSLFPTSVLSSSPHIPHSQPWSLFRGKYRSTTVRCPQSLPLQNGLFHFLHKETLQSP